MPSFQEPTTALLHFTSTLDKNRKTLEYKTISIIHLHPLLILNHSVVTSTLSLWRGLQLLRAREQVNDITFRHECGDAVHLKGHHHLVTCPPLFLVCSPGVAPPQVQ